MVSRNRKRPSRATAPYGLTGCTIIGLFSDSICGADANKTLGLSLPRSACAQPYFRSR